MKPAARALGFLDRWETHQGAKSPTTLGGEQGAEPGGGGKVGGEVKVWDPQQQGLGLPQRPRGSLMAVSWAPPESRRPPQRGLCDLLEIGRLRQGLWSTASSTCLPKSSTKLLPVPQKSASISSPYLLSAHAHTSPSTRQGSSPATRLPEPLTDFQLPLPLDLTACLWAPSQHT